LPSCLLLAIVPEANAPVNAAQTDASCRGTAKLTLPGSLPCRDKARCEFKQLVI
jgi:hypothetical protein